MKSSILISDLFDKCVIKTCRGRSIRCRLGLWGVSAPDAATAERVARSYWQQYYADGEYAAHLSNDKSSHAPSKLEEAAMMVLHGLFACDASYREMELFEVLRESGHMKCNDHGQMVKVQHNEKVQI